MIGESGYMARHDDIVDAVAQIEIERGRLVRSASNRFAAAIPPMARQGEARVPGLVSPLHSESEG
jgi:hypothetical protein